MASVSNVSKEVAKKYIDGYFKEKYPICEATQPNFWEAVEILASDIEADVSALINEKKQYCVPYDDYSSKHVSFWGSDINTVTDLAKKIAAEIIKSESTATRAVDYFLLQKDVEALNERVARMERAIRSRL